MKWFRLLPIFLALITLCLSQTTLSNNALILDDKTQFELSIPDNFNFEVLKSTKQNVADSAKISNNHADLLLSSLPISPQKLQNIGGLETLLNNSGQHYAAGSVEGKVEILKMKRSDAIYASFTDAELVGQPTIKGNWKNVTSGFIRYKQHIIAFSLFSNALQSNEQLALMNTLENAVFSVQ